LTRSPKQTADEQESLILDSAALCIEESSILDFTMSAVGKKAELSIGSIYKHVQSKEDVLVALAERVFSYQLCVFKDVMALPLTTPERLIAVMLLSQDKLCHYPFGVQLKMLASNEAVLQRASSRWIEKLWRVNDKATRVFENAMVDACESGELTVSKTNRDAVISTLSIGLWSMHVGFVEVAYQQIAFEKHKVGGASPFPVAIDHAFVMSAKQQINSFSWKTPLDDVGIERASELIIERGYR